MARSRIGMIYLDHNASTPVRPEVRERIAQTLAGLHANPSSMHRDGQRARAAVELARQQVASLVGARPDEVVFTSGGTEGDHLGLLGTAWARAREGRTVAISSVEHHAMHGAAGLLRHLGYQERLMPVRADGHVEPEAVSALPAGTTVLALMLANNETGVLQPVAEAARLARARGILVLCDAVQAAGKIPIARDGLGADLLVLSAHKLGGPKGVGALVVRTGTPLEPLFRGSAHEGGRRGGTENVPGIVGLGLAAELAREGLGAEGARQLGLRRRLEDGLRAAAPDVVIHGEAAPRLPNTVNASFPGARSDHLLLALDARGVAVSAGAACASGAVEPSPVLRAMGVPRALAVCALRFSVGWTTTTEEVDRALAALAEALPAARAVTSRQASTAGA